MARLGQYLEWWPDSAIVAQGHRATIHVGSSTFNSLFFVVFFLHKYQYFCKTQSATSAYFLQRKRRKTRALIDTWSALQLSQ